MNNKQKIKIRRIQLQLSFLLTLFSVIAGISLGEQHYKIVVGCWIAGAILFQIFISTTYCPHCKVQLFGLIMWSHKEGVELFRFMLGLKDIKCHKCGRIVDLKEANKD